MTASRVAGWVGLLAGVVVVAGCTNTPGAEPGVNVPGPVPEESELAPAPEPEDEAEPEIVLRECRDAERVGAQNTVSDQTTALRDGDFEAAYSYASPSFQDTVSLEQFAGLIIASYQPLLEDVVLEFGDCVAGQDGDELSLDVVLRTDGANSLGIRYILVDTEQGWRVSGASDFRLAGQST